MIAFNAQFLSSFFELVYRPQHDLKPGTVQAYRTAISSIDRWHGSPVPLELLCDGFYSRWLESLGRTATARSYGGHVSCVWRFAHQVGACPNAPRFVRRVKLPRRIPEAWRLDQVERILRAAKAQPGKIGPWAAGDWMLALLLVIYDTGGRITGSMSLRAADCSLAERCCLIRYDASKDDADAWFSLSEQTVAALARIWGERPEVFGDWRFDRKRIPPRWPTLTKRYREVLTRAGLPTGRRDLFHKLRRTTGTQVRIVAGKEVAAACLRHKDSATFTRSYDDTRQGGVISAADYLPRPQLGERQLELF